MVRIGIDTGGTFTDTVILTGDGAIGVGKALTTKHDLTEGIFASIDAAASTLGMRGDDVAREASLVAHATTQGINALLTGTGAQVGLITTAGFEGTVPMAKANKVIGIDEALRTEAAHWHKPPMLLPRRRIVGVHERIDAHGNVLVGLDDGEARAALARLGAVGVESLAVALLWSVVDPRHERRIAELAAQVLPGVPVSLSCEVAPRLGEYGRSITTLLNAYVAPIVATYLDRLRAALGERGFRGRFVVTQSSGGVADAARVARTPVDTLNSGPVGGVSAALALGQRLGQRNVVATDVGGTSFDVGLVADGRLQFAKRPMVGMYPLATPVVDLTSIGTGGGSIAWIDPVSGALRVGPQSAGADPGPASYGRGGTRPTVTDAAVALGYLATLGGSLRLDAARARAALDEHLAQVLGRSVEQVADDVLTVASAQMADLVRRSTVQRGHDPADFALYAYGGAAPQHVGRYAAELGCAAVVVPALASVFSAYGAAATDLRVHTEVELRPALLRTSLAELTERFEQLQARAGAQLAIDATASSSVRIERRVQLRFARQVHALPIVIDGALDADALIAAFRSEYERLVGAGTAFERAEVEVVGAAVEVTAPAVRASASDPTQQTQHQYDASPHGAGIVRPVWFDGAWLDTPVHDGTLLAAGAELAGPALIELPTTTLVVHPGQRVRRDDHGELHLALAPAKGAQR